MRYFPLLRATLTTVVTVALLSGCSSSTDPVAGGNPGGTVNATEGQFFDSAVEGLDYVSGNKSGKTPATGKFGYEKKQSIEFKVGDISLGSGTPVRRMTPIDLVPGATDVTNQAVTNIARFLQTIDDDGNPTNGIKIADVVRNAAAGKSINFDQDPTAFGQDSNVQTVVSDMTKASTAGERPLVGALAAQDHLSATLISSLDGTFAGQTCRDVDQKGTQQSPYGTWSLVVAGGNATVTFSAPISRTFTGTVDQNGIVDISSGGDIIFMDLVSELIWGRWYIGDDSGTMSQDGCTNPN